MSQYDPKTNPRYLGGEEADRDEVELALKERELAEVESQLEAFATPGWKFVEDDLREKVQENFRAMASEKCNTMEAIARERGSMRALNYVITFSARLEQKRALLIEEISSLTEG